MIAKKGKSKNSVYQRSQVDLEAGLAIHITQTGKEQIKKRRKEGLSVFYLKDGRIVEEKPDKTEIKGKQIDSVWITLDKKKRTVILK